MLSDTWDLSLSFCRSVSPHKLLSVRFADCEAHRTRKRNVSDKNWLDSHVNLQRYGWQKFLHFFYGKCICLRSIYTAAWHQVNGYIFETWLIGDINSSCLLKFWSGIFCHPKKKRIKKILYQNNANWIGKSGKYSSIENEVHFNPSLVSSIDVGNWTDKWKVTFSLGCYERTTHHRLREWMSAIEFTCEWWKTAVRFAN